MRRHGGMQGNPRLANVSERRECARALAMCRVWPWRVAAYGRPRAPVPLAVFRDAYPRRRPGPSDGRLIKPSASLSCVYVSQICRVCGWGSVVRPPRGGYWDMNLHPTSGGRTNVAAPTGSIFPKDRLRELLDRLLW